MLGMECYIPLGLFNSSKMPILYSLPFFLLYGMEAKKSGKARELVYQHLKDSSFRPAQDFALTVYVVIASRP